MEEQLDIRVLQRILQCFAESQQGTANQHGVYCELQRIVENVPNFFKYFIHILISATEENDDSNGNSQKILLQQLSIFSLRRYSCFVQNELIPIFLHDIIPILANILSRPLSILTPHAAIILTNIVVSYGNNIFPEFDSLLYSLITNEQTIYIGIDVLTELSLQRKPIQIEHLRFLINVFFHNPESELTSKFLSIILNLIHTEFTFFEDLNNLIELTNTENFQNENSVFPDDIYINFTSSEVLPFIVMNYQKFQLSALSDSMCIIATFFLKTGDSSMGDFLIYCLQNLDDLSCDGLNIISKSKSTIPFYAPFVAALFACLQTNDERLDDYGVSCYSQEILSNMTESHKSLIVSVVMPLISQCQNAGQVLRTLCAIFYEIENPNQFIQFAMQHLHDDSRGDAVLFLDSVANRENLDVSEIKLIISEVIPLLFDPDEIVRDKVAFFLENVFQDKFERNLDWLSPLFQAFTMSVNGADSAYVMRMSKLVYEFLSPIDKLEGEIFQSFFQFVYNLFFCVEKRELMSAVTTILDVLIVKMNIVFTNEIALIIPRINFSLQSEENYSLQSDENFSLCGPFCLLLRSMVEKYPDQILMFYETIKIIADAISKKKTCIYDDAFWVLVNNVLDIHPEMFQSELVDFCVSIALLEYRVDTILPIKLNSIAEAMGKLMKSLNNNLIDQFLKETIEIIQIKDRNVSELYSVVEFLKVILQYKQSNGTLQNDYVSFFECLISGQS